jgi:hypothetical protein
MEKINLSLTVEEVNAIMQVLGQLPTSSNAYPLLVNIKQQAEAQVKQSPKAQEEANS